MCNQQPQSPPHASFQSLPSRERNTQLPRSQISLSMTWVSWMITVYTICVCPLPGESQGRWSLVGCRLWGRTELDTTEATQQQQQQLSVHTVCDIHSCGWNIRRLFLSLLSTLSLSFMLSEMMKIFYLRRSEESHISNVQYLIYNQIF